MRQQYSTASIFSHFLCLLILSVTKQSVKAQIAFDAICPDVTVVRNFDAQKVFRNSVLSILSLL